MSAMEAVRWAIVADDLTGAADAVGHYGATISCAVVFDLESIWPNADILAIDTESRYVAEDEAATLVASAARRSIESGRRVFKKIDSLLRGNIGVEIAAALAAVAQDAHGVAIVAPAFPTTGRTTVDGHVRVNDLPYTDGRFGGNLAEALATGGLRVAQLAAIHGETPQQLAHRIAALRSQALDAIILDATSDDDLDRIARAAELVDFPTLLVGSGGLAGHIMAAGQESAAGLQFTHEADSRLLVVIGSYSELAKSQLGELIASGVRHVTVTPEEMAASAGQRVRGVSAADAGDLVLTPDLALQVEPANASRIATSLADATATIIGDYDALVLTGGETARAVIDALGVGQMTVMGEIEPGVVLSRLPGNLPMLVTKAGAFGDSGTLVRARATLKMTSKPTDTKNATRKVSI